MTIERAQPDCDQPLVLRRALAQAGEAAEFGARVSTSAGVYHYGDLGIYHLLLPLADGPRLANYVEAELGVLLANDARNRVPLVPTLRSFLDHGGHISAAARELFIERRTLYHRVEAIRKLLGRDLGHADTRLRLSVALRALDLLQTRRGTEHTPSPADKRALGATAGSAVRLQTTSSWRWRPLRRERSRAAR